MKDKILFTPLDFLKHEFPSSDVCILGHVLQNYPSETQNKLVQKAYDSLTHGGAIITYQWYLDKDHGNSANDFD